MQDMLIMTQDKNRLMRINATKGITVWIEEEYGKEGEFKIKAKQLTSCYLGTYKNITKAESIVKAIVECYKEGCLIFYMPQSDEDCSISSKEKLPEFYGNVESKTFNFGE